MSLLAYSNNKQPKEQKVYGVPSAFSIFKKILFACSIKLLSAELKTKN